MLKLRCVPLRTRLSHALQPGSPIGPRCGRGSLGLRHWPIFMYRLIACCRTKRNPRGGQLCSQGRRTQGNQRTRLRKNSTTCDPANLLSPNFDASSARSGRVVVTWSVPWFPLRLSFPLARSYILDGIKMYPSMSVPISTFSKQMKTEYKLAAGIAANDVLISLISLERCYRWPRLFFTDCCGLCSASSLSMRGIGNCMRQ